ncbi:MAG: hypothetical protein ACYCQJ_13800 [Nitrososphaerales archaeon]
MNLDTISFLVGSMAGYAALSGTTSYYLGVPHVLMINPDLSPWMYYSNLVASSLMQGFSAIGIYVTVEKMMTKLFK